MEEIEKVPLKEKVMAFVQKNPLFAGLIFVGVILLIIGVIQYLGSKSTKDEAVFIPASSKGAVEGIVAPSKEVSFDIEGGVQKPGVYKLQEGSRVQDALIVSGGLSSSADREYIAKHFNLAQKLTDGVKIYIPQKGEQTEAVVSVEQNLNSNEVSRSTLGDNSGLININSATLDKLDTLPKVGPVTAQKIVSGRPYASKDELVSKKILTQKAYDGLKDKITTE